jgi:hypothetical protein
MAVVICAPGHEMCRDRFTFRLAMRADWQYTISAETSVRVKTNRMAIDQDNHTKAIFDQRT